jgi:hypothetical protein
LRALAGHRAIATGDEVDVGPQVLIDGVEMHLGRFKLLIETEIPTTSGW